MTQRANSDSRVFRIVFNVVASVIIVTASAFVTTTVLQRIFEESTSNHYAAPQELSETELTSVQLQTIRDNAFAYPQEWAYCEGVENDNLISKWQYASTNYEQDVPEVTSAVIEDFKVMFRQEREYEHPGNWSESATIDNQNLQPVGETSEVFVYKHTYTETNMIDHGETKSVKSQSNCIGFLKHVNQAEKRFTKVDTQSVKYFFDKLVASMYGTPDDLNRAEFVASVATDEGDAIVYQYYLNTPRYATCSQLSGGDAVTRQKVTLGGTCTDGFDYEESGGYVTLNTVRVDKTDGRYVKYPGGPVVTDTEQRLTYSGNTI